MWTPDSVVPVYGRSVAMAEKREVVIVGAARTPIGAFLGSLSSLPAPKLGAVAIKAALERSGVKPDDVELVIMGNVLQAGVGQAPARQAMIHAGVPEKTPAVTLNKVCGSGLESVIHAARAILVGDADVAVAGGMESMSNAPYLLPKARWGHKMGDGSVKDLMIYDGLTCTFTGVHMGTYGNSCAKEMEISREAQDEWSYQSHQKALAAIENGLYAQEIVPVEIPQRKGDPIVVKDDESPRKDTSLERLAKLKPVFDHDGTITAGNAPGVNDGAAALVLMSEERAASEGKEVLATIIGHTSIAVEAKDFPKTPGLVIEELLKKTGKKVEDIDLFEINEAFAAVALASAKIAGLNLEKVNVNGGAVALGHPIGASGARIIISLVHELKRRGGGIGIASICSGGGQGDAIMVEVKC